MTQKRELKLFNSTMYHCFVIPNVSMESLTPAAF